MLEKIAEEVVSLVSEQPAEFLATLKSEDGEWKSEDEIKSAIREAHKVRLQGIVKEQSGRAVRERMSAAQKFIRENYGIESDGPLEDHLKTLVEKLKSEKAPTKVVEKLIELDEEGLRKHPKFEEMLKSQVIERTTAAQKERDEWKEKYQSYISQQEQQKLDAAIFAHAKRELHRMKAMLSEDPETQERQISGFAAILKSNYRFKLPEDTNEPPVPVNEKGDPLEDASFNRRTFSEIAQRENIFGVHQFDPKKKSPEATKTNQRPTVTQVGEIKGDADYMARMRKAKTREEKEAIRDAYKSQQEAAAAAKA